MCGHNSLNECIPTWIKESPFAHNLKLHSLKSNEFNRKIHLNLCHLNFIQILDLSLNNLFRIILSFINNFTILTHYTDDANANIP